MKKAQDWAIRLSHEAQYHENSIFLTLTFTDEALAGRDNPGSIDVAEVQRFIKRLRRRIDYNSKRENTTAPKLRYYAVGEYGEKTARPHYHILLFGWKPEDGQLHKTSPKGSKLFVSGTLSELWPYGWINYGEVSWDSASYCAGYITKKFNDSSVPDRLKWKDPITGLERDKEPEFATCSRNPPIGYQWLEDNYEDLLEHDYIVIKGKKRSIPRAYDKWLRENFPDEMEDIEDKRLVEFQKAPHITEERRLDMHLAKWHQHTQRLREAEENGTDGIHDIRQQSKGIPKAILHAKRRYRHPNA